MEESGGVRKMDLSFLETYGRSLNAGKVSPIIALHINV